MGPLSLIFSHRSDVRNDKSLKRKGKSKGRNLSHIKSFKGPTGKFSASLWATTPLVKVQFLGFMD